MAAAETELQMVLLNAAKGSQHITIYMNCHKKKHAEKHEREREEPETRRNIQHAPSQRSNVNLAIC